MRLRVKFWRQGTMPFVSGAPAARLGGLLRGLFSWQGLGAALLGMMLAKWAWALLGPASQAMPSAEWKTSADADRLFGTASVTDAQSSASLGNIKLVGVFANRSKGFAVMQVDEKQVGVALGEEVTPGVRLVETHPDHVTLERGNERQRVDLSAGIAPGATVVAAPRGVPAPAATSAPATSASVAPNQSAREGMPLSGPIDAMQQLDARQDPPPVQREILKHRLQDTRRQH